MTLPPDDDAAPAPSDLPGGEAAAVEAILAVVDEPLPESRLAQVLGLPRTRVRDLLLELAGAGSPQAAA